jgi:small subunit ribosomal protein S8
MKQDMLADVFYSLNNAEIVGKKKCTVPASKLVKNILMVMQKEGYIGSFEFIDNGKSGHFDVDMVGRINKSRIIKPRLSVKKHEFEKWESRYLPALNFGILIMSTPKGIMSQKEALENNTGGRLLGYVY